jgi:hypothetical protein
MARCGERLCTPEYAFLSFPSIERLSEVSVPLISNFLLPLSDYWDPWHLLKTVQSSTSAEQLVEVIDPPIFQSFTSFDDY